MNKNKYTKLEIKLYEGLAKISSIQNDMMRIGFYNFSKISKIDSKWLSDFIDNLVKMRDILRKAKIPKKFLILNSLENG